MPPSGTRLGPYEIVSLIGAGGMGEVYRGRDARLGRDVAIKILPPLFSSDADRLRRFEQEARAAAALSHPNILAVYDVGEQNGSPYIVSELLEGEPLRNKVQQPLPHRRAIGYAIEVADGLAAAHDKGIVHRDLKPENIFITGAGFVKILDFGLAKLTLGAAAAGSGSAATIAADTQPGSVLGTAGYMSPEQVRGDPVDHRSDIFAAGAILYEMVSGRRAFAGASIAETMSAILRDDPPDLTEGTPAVPPALARIIDRCLQKDPASRFQSSRDLAFALEQLSTASGSTATVAAVRQRFVWLPWGLFAAAALSAIVISAIALRPRPPLAPGQAIRFNLPMPGGISITASGNFVAVAPDGRQIALAAAKDGKPMLWIHTLDAAAPKSLPDTERLGVPFWSPDGRYVGFFSDGKLKKVSADGGPPQTLSTAPEIINGTGATWNQFGVILFSSIRGPILRVPDAGGRSEPATTLGAGYEEEWHLFPQFLPDGRRFLFYLRNLKNADRSGIYVQTLDSRDVRRVVSGGSRFAYVPPGYLVYARDGLLMAQPFDPERAVVTGDPMVTPERVEQIQSTGNVAFSLSSAGTLAYRASGQAAPSRLRWFDRDGTPLGAIGEPAAYRNPRLSPDGRKIVVEIVDNSGEQDLWLLDVLKGTSSRFTFNPGRDAAPVWSRDGEKIAWQTAGDTRVKSAAGGREEVVYPEPFIPDDWQNDGAGLLLHPGQPRQLLLLPLTGEDRQPRVLVEGQTIQTHARLSPDGRWLAFSTNDSGRFEVDVQSYPSGAYRTRVSVDGGLQPKWRPDGKELFYLTLDGTLMAVPIVLGDTFQADRPRPLFATGVDTTTGVVWHQYDVSPDGRRFLVDVPLSAPSLAVVVNWPALLARHP
jgi:Tol biopolymer transport system component